MVFLDDAKRWFVFALRTGQAPASPADAVPVPTQKKVPVMEPVAPTALLNDAKPDRPLVLELLCHFPLSSAVTMVHMDESKSLLVIGQEDGVVSLWDTRNMLPLSVPTKHNSPVTCACLTSGIRSHTCHW